jgi:hypothetical protein
VVRSPGSNGREHRDLIVPAARGGHGLELPRALLGQAEKPAQALIVTLVPPGPAGIAEGLTLDEQQTLEVQQGVRQEGLALQSEDLPSLLDSGRVPAAQARADFRQPLLEIPHRPQVFPTLPVLAGEALGEVLNSHLQRPEVDLLQITLRIGRGVRSIGAAHGCAQA